MLNIIENQRGCSKYLSFSVGHTLEDKFEFYALHVNSEITVSSILRFLQAKYRIDEGQHVYDGE